MTHLKCKTLIEISVTLQIMPAVQSHSEHADGKNQHNVYFYSINCTTVGSTPLVEKKTIRKQGDFLLLQK